MLGFREQFIDRRFFDDFSGVHHSDPVGDFRYDAEVVRD